MVPVRTCEVVIANSRMSVEDLLSGPVSSVDDMAAKRHTVDIGSSLITVPLVDGLLSLDAHC